MSLIQDLLPHMRRVHVADRELHDLSLIWTMIEATSAISCPEEAEAILPTLVQTREAFSELHGRLVQQLGQEHLAALRDELSSTAQCAIDILVRNLFERTADVGFLATDDELRRFCAATEDERQAQRAALQARLAEYRNKYTVYDDIILLSPEGQVLARLDAGQTLVQSHDPVVEQSVVADGYVQRYGASDLASGAEPALLYGHRIASSPGRCVGVLVLRFRLSDEMQRIFTSVSPAERSLAVVLVDDTGRVVVSNDTSHVPIGSRVPLSAGSDLSLSNFAGREYLGVTCPTRGYQGYQGLGWRAHAMVSLLTAFQQRSRATEQQQGVALDNPELHQVQADVDAINRNLRRVVWNGRLSASLLQGNASRLKAVLQQVNTAGERMRDRVGRAIQDLYGASLGRAQHQADDLARLAADIMDRNLYERANDCRWWALSPLLQRVLAEPASQPGSQALQAMLAHINSLYTVYTRLVAFDVQGQVRAVSRDVDGDSLVGTAIPGELLAATLELRDSQSYAVSPFSASALSEGVATYTYLAAVRCPTSQRVVGGIAIVFNAAAEFRAMVEDVLGERDGIAAFVDASGALVACTDTAQAPGQAFAMDLQQSIVEHQSAHWALAHVPAAGYREFNAGGGYRHGVSAVVALRLGALERRRAALCDRGVHAEPLSARQATQELAVFQTGAARYALPASAVMSARETEHLVRLPVGAEPVIGLLDVGAPGQPAVIPVICARRLLGVHYPSRENDGVVVVITLEHRRDQPLCGLRVDDVIGVVDVALDAMQPLPEGLRSSSPFLDSVVRVQADGADAQPVLLQVMRPLVLAALAKPVQALQALPEPAGPSPVPLQTQAAAPMTVL